MCENGFRVFSGIKLSALDICTKWEIFSTKIPVQTNVQVFNCDVHVTEIYSELFKRYDIHWFKLNKAKFNDDGGTPQLTAEKYIKRTWQFGKYGLF